MLQYGESIEELSKKYFVDPKIYEGQLEAVLGDFVDELAALKQTVRSEREREEVGRLESALDQYSLVLAREKKTPRPSVPGDLPPDLAEEIAELRGQTEVTSRAVELAIPEQVRLAAEAGAEGERVSWIIAGFALFIGVLVMVLIVRAINDSLRQLTQGTRLIARGQFWHRLPTEGGDEFSEVARDFNAMTRRLGELDMMKKDFVSHVSHELKAPLASMRQVVHLLIQEIAGPLNEQQKNLLNLSYKSANRLSAMVGNLLDISRMEAGTMEYEISKHDLVSLLKGVAEEFEVQANERKVRLNVHCSHPEVNIDCDRDRIVQVIGNLFENALKFSPPDSEIIARIDHRDNAPEGYERFARAGSGVLENGFAVLSVADSGPGVPDAHKSRVFAKFHQVKQGKKIAGQGVGLGLAICKTIVDAHGGAIWVEDNPRGGSVFFVVVQASAKAESLKCVTSA
jgi:two-component system sensor histidine kinase GlrK